MMIEALFLFLLGSAIGSFLNVLIYRYEPGASVFGRHLGGRSLCPRCKKKLSWYELLPIISFIIQRGKCRHCKQNISFQYPVVEIIAGLIVMTIPQIIGDASGVFIFVTAFLVLLTASVIDIRHYVIPDALTIIVALLGVIRTALISIEPGSIALVPGSFLGSYAYIFSFTNNPLIANFSAAIVSGVFFATVILFSKGKAMGWGDAKLAFAIGLLIGWPDTIMALMIAFIIGAIIGIYMLTVKTKKLKDALPFGPFIAIGVAVVVYFGHNIISAYFDMLNFIV